MLTECPAVRQRKACRSMCASRTVAFFAPQSGLRADNGARIAAESVNHDLLGDLDGPPIQLDGSTMIPELLRAMPAARSVLDRYGLQGCGGPLGPHESLEFFARAHDVPLERLLEEIRQAAAAAGPATALPFAETLADSIYRPFFRAGIAVVLTLGAAWGVVLLLRIAWSRSFTAVSIHEINAYGHAQIFG